MATRESTKRFGNGAYAGVLREGNRIVWQCPHSHCNRDNDSYGYIRYGEPEGMSALTCARKQLEAQTIRAILTPQPPQLHDHVFRPEYETCLIAGCYAAKGGQ